MVNGIRASFLGGLSKGRGLKYRVGSQVRQEKPEESSRTNEPGGCEYSYKDNSQKTLSDKNHKDSSRNSDNLSIPFSFQ